MTRNKWPAILAILLTLNSQAMALTADDAKAMCDQMKAAARGAAQRDLDRRKLPNLAQTFEDASKSCLDRISNFRFGVNAQSWTWAAIEAALMAAAQNLINKVCQAAIDQFQKQVDRASAVVNNQVDGTGINNIPGVNVGVSGQAGAGSSGVDISTDNTNTSQMNNALDNASDRIVNMFK